MFYSFSFFLVFTFVFFEIDIHSFALIDNVAKKIQVLCYDFYSSSQSYSKLTTALTCGKKIHYKHFYFKILASTGVIHLFVISGYHLSAIEKLSSYIPNKLFNKLFSHIIMIALLFTTGFSFSCFRTYIQKITVSVQKKFSIPSSRSFLVLKSGITTLIFLPEGAESYSLLLSWTASLVVYCLKTKNQMLKNFVIYLSLFPILIKFSPPHPFSVVIQTILANTLAPLLLPLAFLLPEFIKNIFWKYFIQVLTVFHSSFDFHFTFKVNKIWLWFYIFILHLLFHCIEVSKIRKQVTLI